MIPSIIIVSVFACLTLTKGLQGVINDNREDRLVGGLMCLLAGFLLGLALGAIIYNIHMGTHQ